MNTKNRPDTNNPSLYEDGQQLQKHSTDLGYTMDPASQGLHGPGQQAANRARARSMDNMAHGGRDALTLAGAVGAGLLAYRYLWGRTSASDSSEGRKGRS